MAASVPVVSAGSIDQRFAQLIQQFGLTKNSFAISLGKTASVVQHLIDGRNKPGFDLMCKVFEVYPNVSRDWLLLGRGPMLIGSTGLSGPALAAAQPAAPEPDFEPIDLADVAPRAPRRPSALRLQPEEIASTLAIANSVVEAPLAGAVATTTPAAAGPDVPTQQITPPAPQPARFTSAAPVAAAPGTPVTPAADTRRPMRPFRPSSAPATQPAVAPVAMPEVPTVPVIPPPAEAAAPEPAAIMSPPPVVAPADPAPAALQPAAPASNPEAYVAAAIHAQHLQHQLAMAELRNQHLLEQQQMLREMLAMARQSMV